ncbi:MAG: two pore domain potassium channel family protein [Spirulinaceae cyanobacterium SM2_1_0]|nr:two pore domain potassium channel family protein [Spirulinaceae cyanobacterium SM2_1_0]
MPDADRSLRDALQDEEFARAVAQILAEQLRQPAMTARHDAEVVAHYPYPRYSALIRMRQVVSGLALVLMIGAIANTFEPWLRRLPLTGLGFAAAGLTVITGVSLIALLVSEVFRGAGLDVAVTLRRGTVTWEEYRFIPSLNRLTFVLVLLVLGFLTIIFGFASLYTELLRQNPAHFQGLQDGFLAIYFAIVTFSTVGYGDIHPASELARGLALTEIIIAMFFSLIAISAILSWAIADKRQQAEVSLATRIRDRHRQALKRSETPSDTAAPSAHCLGEQAAFDASHAD